MIYEPTKEEMVESIQKAGINEFLLDDGVVTLAEDIMVDMSKMVDVLHNRGLTEEEAMRATAKMADIIMRGRMFKEEILEDSW